MEIVTNSKGRVYYGMHFYPGVAEYLDPSTEAPYRVFLNENTIREMGPTFEGRPVFVQHVDDVTSDLNELRKEADGWVVESFFNEADGKHWVKFIVVSEKGERAIKQGMRLSNCYLPTKFGQGGLWNGVAYAKQVVAGEYEHLAIVPNPRYEESVILSPEKFKEYNESQKFELKRLANDKGKGKSMKLNFFKRSPIENASDIEYMSVVLPSGREVSIKQLVLEADKKKNDDTTSSSPSPSPSTGPSLNPAGVESIKKAFGNEGLADPAHKVKLHDGSYCNVAELVEKHKAMYDELEAMKAKSSEKNDDEDQDEDYAEEGEPKHNMEGKDQPKGETPSDLSGGDDKDESPAMVKEKPEKEVDDAKKKNDLEKAKRLRNAHLRVEEPTETAILSCDMVEVGKQRYGS